MKVDQLYRIAPLARELQQCRTTIQSAIGRGEIKAHLTGCGVPLITRSELQKWIAKAPTRKPGRPPKQGA